MSDEKVGKIMMQVIAEVGPIGQISKDALHEIWTAEDEAAYAPLRRKKLRIEAKTRRDKSRKRVFNPRQAQIKLKKPRLSR